MAKRSMPEVFVDTLVKMAAGTPNGRVSSNALEAKLAWTVEGRYTKIRQDLIKRGEIRAYPGGAGGSLEPVAQAGPPVPKALKAFISYSHADSALKNELLKHLAPLRRLELVDHWDDGEILVGQEWEKAIWGNLQEADIIILLITVDFINSEYCYTKELSAAVERHKTKSARIIPVIGRNCLWQNLSFGHIQATLNGKAILSLPNQDDALTEVAKEIKRVAEELKENRARDK